MLTEILKYQEVDGQLQQIERELLSSNERLKLVKAKKFLGDVDSNVAVIDTRAGELCFNYKNLIAKITEIQKTITEYTKDSESSINEDELKYFTKKINHLDEQMKFLEKEANDIINEMTALSQSFEELKKKAKNARNEFEVNKKKYDELKESRAEEMENIKKEMAKIAKKANPDLLSKYQKIRGDKIFPVFVPLMDDMCGGCRMELALNKKSELLNKKMIECDECRRIIYVL